MIYTSLKLIIRLRNTSKMIVENLGLRYYIIEYLILKYLW